MFDGQEGPRAVLVVRLVVNPGKEQEKRKPEVYSSRVCRLARFSMASFQLMDIQLLTDLANGRGTALREHLDVMRSFEERLRFLYCIKEESMKRKNADSTFPLLDIGMVSDELATAIEVFLVRGSVLFSLKRLYWEKLELQKPEVPRQAEYYDIKI